MSSLPVCVSFGGGVQSTVIADMVITGHPLFENFMRPTAWIFADTGAEPTSVYRHVEEWGNHIEDAGMTFEIIKRKGLGLTEHVLSRAAQGLGGINLPPLYVDRAKRGGKMPVWRGCTRAFKAVILDQQTKKMFGVRRGEKTPRVAKWIGISTDEAQRMRTPDQPWYVNNYPLIDVGMSRTDCIGYLRERGIDAPRSACVYCPFHSDREWHRLKTKEPEAFAQAVAFEQALWVIWDDKGSIAGLKSRPSLHESGEPIGTIDFEKGQGSMFSKWDNDCSGVCGV